jgi:hypothetical protein
MKLAINHGTNDVDGNRNTVGGTSMREKIIKPFRILEQSYEKRNKADIESFMTYFSNESDAQMIGIGAIEPGEYEWFTGKDEIKEIILSDWKYWGNVHFDIDNIRLTTRDNVAWFSLCAQLEQIESSEETWEFFASQMMNLLKKEDAKAADRIFEAAHYGIRRVREKNLGKGHLYDMVITGTLVYEDALWKFHTLHWSMPVD